MTNRKYSLLLDDTFSFITAIVFAANWKRLTIQHYVRKYRAAVIIVRKSVPVSSFIQFCFFGRPLVYLHFVSIPFRFIVGFMNRKKPKCDKNFYVSWNLNLAMFPGHLHVCLYMLSV